MSVDASFLLAPTIRIAAQRPDGTLSGYEDSSIAYYGGTVPNVGDVIGDVWNEGEYDFWVVQRRYFISEYEGESYWLIVVRTAEPAPQFEEVCKHALLVTDLVRAHSAKRPAREIAERTNQLSLTPDPASKNYRPKFRKPTEPKD